MPFKGCLSDACVLMKIERFVLKPLRKIERFVLKQHTFRFADYKRLSCGNRLWLFIFSFFFSPQEWMLPVDSLHLAACAIVGICCDNGLGGLFREGSVDAYNVSDGRSVG